MEITIVSLLTFIGSCGFVGSFSKKSLESFLSSCRNCGHRTDNI